MKDPYVYSGTDILKNLANIRDADLLAQMEADYTSSRLSDLVTRDYEGLFDVTSLCQMHYIIFQDIFDWAGKIRVVNIEKEEPALGGISIEYSDYSRIEEDVDKIFKKISDIEWKQLSIEAQTKFYSDFMGGLWKIHPFREGNTRTVVTFCSQFIEQQGCYINSDLFRDNAQYVRIALVAYNALFHDLGDREKPEYLEQIVMDALKQGILMKSRVVKSIIESGYQASEELIRKVVYWNRQSGREHNGDEISDFCKRYE